MIKGGYKIINLKGVSLKSGVAQNIKGTHKAIESNYGKATLLSGLTVNGTDYQDMFVNFTVSGTNYVATTVVGTLTISKNDDVTIGTSSSGGSSGSIG